MQKGKLKTIFSSLMVIGAMSGLISGAVYDSTNVNDVELLAMKKCIVEKQECKGLELKQANKAVEVRGVSAAFFTASLIMASLIMASMIGGFSREEKKEFQKLEKLKTKRPEWLPVNQNIKIEDYSKTVEATKKRPAKVITKAKFKL